MFIHTTLNRRLMVRLVVCLLLMALGDLRGAPPVHAAAGDLDLTFAGFGSGGKVITTGVSGSVYDMALQADGKIVVAGCSANKMLVMRYLSNGVLDPTFGSNGIATFSNVFSLCANAVALQADGKIVVAGWFGTSPSSFMLARLTPSGGLDTSFGSGGYVSTDFDNGADFAQAVLVQTDGKVVAAGYAHVGGDDDIAVARYNANGSLDNSFSSDGKVTIGFGGDD